MFECELFHKGKVPFTIQIEKEYSDCLACFEHYFLYEKRDFVSNRDKKCIGDISGHVITIQRNRQMNLKNYHPVMFVGMVKDHGEGRTVIQGQFKD